MYHEKTQPDAAILSKLEPLDRFSKIQLEVLSQVLQIQRADKGETLIHLGDTDNFHLYLLRGKLRLNSTDGRVTDIDEHSPQARKPIAQLHCYIGSPRMQQLPTLNQVPAFLKLGIGELSPRLSIKILDKAKEKIARAEALLN